MLVPNVWFISVLNTIVQPDSTMLLKAIHSGQGQGQFLHKEVIFCHVFKARLVFFHCRKKVLFIH